MVIGVRLVCEDSERDAVCGSKVDYLRTPKRKFCTSDASAVIL